MLKVGTGSIYTGIAIALSASDVSEMDTGILSCMERPYDKGIIFIPTGDPDCRPGVKRGSNQKQADGSKEEYKEYLWGCGSGLAATTNRGLLHIN